LADIALNAWSIPELHMARLLRATGITGHKPNHEIHAGNRTYYLDQAFNAEKLAIEIDGRTVHGTIDGYEHTMMRTAHLERHSWKVLHITPTMLRHHPHFVLDWVATHLHTHHKPTRHYTEPQLRHIIRSCATSWMVSNQSRVACQRAICGMIRDGRSTGEVDPRHAAHTAPTPTRGNPVANRLI